MLKSNGKIIKNPKEVYLDNASSTPVDKDVLLDWHKTLKTEYANPSAIHDMGMKAKNLLEHARTSISEVLGTDKNNIIFTSGATESNNLGIIGVLHLVSKPHIITTNIEHASILELLLHLEEKKLAEVTYVPVERNGIVDPKKIRAAIKSNTVLISVMYANNEIGTVQPISEIAKEIRHYKKNSSRNGPYFREGLSFPIFHTDATQAINYLPIKIEKLGVDMLSFNGAKIYGPKGVGVLFAKKNILLEKIIWGGEQERGKRAGTENVAGVKALALALEITEKIKNREVKRLIKLRDYFFKKLSKINFVTINGDINKRLPNNINITIKNIPSDLLVIELGERGISAASKSACKSGDGKASHVIQAINKNIKDTDGSIRFSMGRMTKKEDIAYTVKSLQEILKKLERWYY